jgi:hypothetical protein
MAVHGVVCVDRSKRQILQRHTPQGNAVTVACKEMQKTLLLPACNANDMQWRLSDVTLPRVAGKRLAGSNFTYTKI